MNTQVMIQVILIAFSLAMDAFTVSLSNGMLLKNFKIKYALKFGIYFGFFQFIMPIAGYYLADTFKEQVEKFDYIIAFILLNAIGFNMIFNKESEDEDNKDIDNKDIDNINIENINNKILCFRNMITLSIATSIDAFAVGSSFYALKINILIASIIIGIVAFGMSFIGIYIGNKLGSIFLMYFSKYSEKIGGIILILIAFKILIFNYVG